MKIYTKSGDRGQTDCASGRRVSKCDQVIRAVGTLDELNSNVGLCLAGCDQDDIRDVLAPIQSELLTVGTVLMTGHSDRLDESAIRRMEKQIDGIWGNLGKLTSFILPGGCELSARLHVTRTVCRRAERNVVAWADTGAILPQIVTQYLNRLSDLLFVLARQANHNAGIPDITWKS